MKRSSELTYTPAWWVRGPHLQTLWGKFFRRKRIVATRAESWVTPDGDELEIQRLDATLPNAPRVLILHGLEGTIKSHYLQGMLGEIKRRGWAADVLIFRGCNGKQNLVQRMYHSGETTDVDFVARRLINENPGQRLAFIGFSLGGNVLLKYLGELGQNHPAPVSAAVAISVPFDLERGSRHIETGFSRVYTRHFLRTLKRKAALKLAAYPHAFSKSKLEQAKTLFEFDDAVTSPLHGFDGASDYYHRSSSVHYISDIRLPTLLISARDDPFLPPSVLDTVAKVSRRSAYLLLEITHSGGHVGFVSGRNILGPQYYAERRAVEFIGNQLTPT